jgi:alpha-galactosidase
MAEERSAPPGVPLHVWRLDDGHQTMALASWGGLPEIVHWGAPLPPGEDLAELAAASRSDLSGGSLDAVEAISLCPEAGRGFHGHPGVVLLTGDGAPLWPRFRLVDASGGGALAFEARDAALGLTYRARIEPRPEGILALTAEIEAEAPVRLRWLAAPVLPGPDLCDEILDLSGRWLGEMRPVRTPWTPGARLREGRGGRSGHEHAPLAYLLGRGATEGAGEVWALHYAWSGGHRLVAEELPDGRRQIQMGHAEGAELAPGRRFETASLLAAWSGAGINGAAVRLQRHLRDHVVPWPDRARPRPVHANCWEAVYFDHELAGLSEIAERAAALGAERFVLDDGWFGRRDDDTTSLGDWTVDRRKWPDGLGPLVERVRALGMSFGLWLEPEMVSEDSDLFRAHPDWALGPADQTLGRGQRLLDMGRAEVRDHLFGAIDDLLREHPIEAIKWDHNRLLPHPDASQTRGAYALLDRLREAHPGVEIESCASGGGRIDFGVLARTHRVWLSDSNDALERLRIQRDAAFWLPAAVTGAHVGPRRSHSSGRVLPMAFRAWVAAMRHMGLELDPRETTEEEAETLARVVAWWKANRDWTMAADIHRLESADPAVLAEMQVARDGSRFVVFAGQAEASAQTLPRPLRLTGLDPAARYALRLANPEDAPPQSRGPVALRDGPLRLTGAALMSHGLRLPVPWPATMWVVEGRRLDGEA